MKKTIILSILSTVFYAVAIVGYFLPWIYQIEPGMGGYNYGYEAALNFGGAPANLPSAAALAILVIGLIMSIVFLIINIAKRKKYAEQTSLNVKRYVFVLIISSIFTFVSFFGIVTVMEAYGIANDTFVMMDQTWGYFMGEGVILSGVFSVLANVCFYWSASGASL